MLLGALLGCIAPAKGPAAPPAEAALSVPPLRSVAGNRKIGAAVETQRLREPAFAQVLAANFNSLTPENEMKWFSIEPAPGQFAFRAGDALVAFADGPGGELRSDSPFSALGPSYITDAFRAAHEADPAAVLFYNDYNIEGPGKPKTEAVYRLVQQLKAAGVPIGGVGFQMHVDPRDWPDPAAIRANLARFAALGLAVEITEMDVPVGEIPGDRAHKLDEQKRITHDVVAACVAVPACSGITFWGVTDRYSWLNDPHWGQLRGRGPHYPLPFDADYRPKPMAAGIADALAGR